MTALREEIQTYIDCIPDSKLQALRPLLSVLADDTLVVETDLTGEEKKIVAQGRKEYERGGFVSLDDIG